MGVGAVIRVMNEQVRQELAKRNAQRIAKVIKEMGTKYLCHPANRVQRKESK